MTEDRNVEQQSLQNVISGFLVVFLNKFFKLAGHYIECNDCDPELRDLPVFLGRQEEEVESPHCPQVPIQVFRDSALTAFSQVTEVGKMFINPAILRSFQFERELKNRESQDAIGQV